MKIFCITNLLWIKPIITYVHVLLGMQQYYNVCVCVYIYIYNIQVCSNFMLLIWKARHRVTEYVYSLYLRTL